MPAGTPSTDEMTLDDLEGDDWLAFFDALDKDGSPTGYLFRCLHCGALGGYTDSD